MVVQVTTFLLLLTFGYLNKIRVVARAVRMEVTLPPNSWLNFSFSSLIQSQSLGEEAGIRICSHLCQIELLIFELANDLLNIV